MEKTSPDTRIGTLSPYFSVSSSRASRLMGVVDGVLRVRGWIVSQSMWRSWSGPRTVSIKSIVFLYHPWVSLSRKSGNSRCKLEESYRRSLCTRIFTLTLRPRELSTSLSNPIAHPSLRNRLRVSSTISRTSSRFSISAAPSVSAHAQDCGQPQLRSTPPTYGMTRDEARASSCGTFAPNWTIVGG